MAGDEILLPAASLTIHLYFCRKSVPHCLPSSQCFPDYGISTRAARALSKGRSVFPQSLLHCQEGKATLMEIENQQKGRTPLWWHAGVNLPCTAFAFVCVCVHAEERT